MNKSKITNIRSLRSLHNIEDAGQFMKNLLIQQPSEITYALRFFLLTPAQSAEIFNAQWSDIDFMQRQWIIKRPQQNPTTGGWSVPCIAELSNHAIECLNQLHQHTGNQGCLFPDLYKLKRADRDKQIAQAIKAIWGHYPVDVNSFRDFIGAMAHEHSYFQSAFINQAIANKYKAAAELASFNYHKRALADWWGNELAMRANNVYSPFNGNV